MMASLMFAGFRSSVHQPLHGGQCRADRGRPEIHLSLRRAGTLFSARLIGWLADRVGKIRMFIGSADIAAAILLLTHWRTPPLGATLAVTTLFMVFVSGRMVPAMAIVTGAVAPQHRGSFMVSTAQPSNWLPVQRRSAPAR